MAAGLLEETKSVLKSLIISCPHGMTIDRLNRDYREMEGKAIPYSQLGYDKLETFLRSLSDTLVVTGFGFNATVSAIASKKTAHIDKMVTKQKSSTRRRARLKSPERNDFSHNHQALKQDSTSHRSQNATNSLPQLWQHNSQPLNQTKQPQSIALQTAYEQQQRQIQNIIARHNFMQNCYQLNQSSAASLYHNYYSHPLLNQPQVKYDNWQSLQYSLQTRPQYLHQLKQQQQLLQNSPLIKQLNSTLNTNNSYQSNTNSPHQSSTNNSHQIQKSQGNASTNQSEKQESVMNTQLQPNNVPNHHRNDAYQRDTSDAAKNAVKVNEAALKVPIQNLEPRHCVNGKGSSGQESSSVSTLSRNTPDVEKPNHSTHTIEKTSSVSRVNNGDPFHELSAEFIAELEDSFATLSLSTSAKKSDKLKVNNHNAEAVPELQKNDLVFQLDFPVDTVKYGESIPKGELPKELMESDWFGVFITEIHNPYKFWFHLYKENHELDTLMLHIENIYTKLSLSEMQLHKACYKPGQVCCALYMGLWHRAQILEPPENGKVKVLFVDYGTVSPVNTSEVKYLLTEFSSLPSQALRGSLAHIKPVKHRWTRDATYAFLEMVTDLLLYAKATEIDDKENIVTMVLTDTNKKVDFQINEALIRKGHARISPAFQSKNTESQPDLNKRRKHFQELYPTFEMLETGEYPSFYEISVLLSKGIDFESLQDENIIPDVDGGHSIDEIAKKLSENKVITHIDHTLKPKSRNETGVESTENKHTQERLLKNCSDYENSSISSLSETLNPFASDMTTASKTVSNTKVGNNVNNVASALECNSNIIQRNPFLSDSDTDSENHEHNAVLSESDVQAYSQFQVPSHPPPNQIIAQTQQIMYYNYLPPTTVPMALPRESCPNPYVQTNGFIPNHQMNSLALNRQMNGFAPSPQTNGFTPSPQMNGLAPNPQMNGLAPNPQMNGFAAYHPMLNHALLSTKLMRPPPGFEHIVPKARNAFQ